MTRIIHISLMFLILMSFVLLHNSIKEPEENNTNPKIISGSVNNSSRIKISSNLYKKHYSNNTMSNSNVKSDVKTPIKTRQTFKLSISDMKAIDSIVFIGDSNMYRQTLAYAALHHKNCVSLTSRCNFRQIYPEFYADKTPNYTWVKPRIGVEGPTENGLVHPGCADCGGCTALTCGKLQQVRYFPVEFARDVMLQSKNNKNSQEVFAKHIAKHPASICVLNVGLHDQSIPKIMAVQYAQNVFDFIKQLHGCHYLIWQQITAVRGDPNQPQTNARIERWNAVIESHPGILAKLSNILYVYNMSRQHIHQDNVHFHEKYYNSVAKTLPSVI